MTWIISLLVAGAIHASSPVAANYDYPQEVSQQVVSSQRDEIETTDETYQLSPNGRVSVSNINGSVEVIGWDRPEVQLITKKVANNAERLKDLDVIVDSSSDMFKVEVDYKRSKGKWGSGDTLYVNFKLMIPRTAFVDKIESVNGGIELSDLRRITVAAAVNGTIIASHLTGKIRLSTVNGSVDARLPEVENGSEIELSTVNGAVSLKLPTNINATIKAHTLNGQITNGFKLPVKKGKYVGNDMYGRIGNGSNKIKLNSVNGSISVNFLADGGTRNPVEDLLHQKNADDFDESFDGEFEASVTNAEGIATEDRRRAVESARLSTEIERTAVISDRQNVIRAVRDAEKAVEATKAFIETIDMDRLRAEADAVRMTQTVFGERPVPFILEDTRTIPVEANPSVVIDAPGCNVTVKGWDRNEVKYSVMRLARGRATPVENVSLGKEESKYKLNVKLLRAPAENEILEQVRVEVYVPRKSNLNIKTDREIRLEGVSGQLELVGKAGAIDVRDSDGALSVTTKTGTLRVIGFKGKLDSNAGTADQYLEGEFKKINSQSKGGHVFLTVQEGGGATIQTNAFGLNERSSAAGNALIIGGMELKSKTEDTWTLGNGEAAFTFSFSGGKLFVRASQIS